MKQIDNEMNSSNKGADPHGVSTNQRQRIRICPCFSTLVKLEETSEGVSSQGPQKWGGTFWHKAGQANGFCGGLKEMSLKTFSGFLLPRKAL